MPTIFIPNKGTHDYSDALRYGTLVFVTKGEQNAFGVGNMARVWAKVLKDSSPSDYILPSSLTNLVAIGCALFALRHGRLNLLLFRNDRYIERVLDFTNIFEENEQ